MIGLSRSILLKFMKSILTILSLIIAAASLQAGTSVPAKAPAAVQPAKGDGNVAFLSHDRRDGANYNALGWYHALNNDLSLSGLFTRAFVGVGQYDYQNFGVPGANITGTLFDADAGLGYRHVTQHLVLGTFAALHVRDRNLSMIDPANNVGTDWGVRFGADATGTYNNFYYSAQGQVSSVEWAVWARARLGYQFGRITIGPEYVYIHDAMFNERRVGGFVTAQITSKLSVSASFGSSDFGSSTGGAGNTPYGGLAMSFTF